MSHNGKRERMDGRRGLLSLALGGLAMPLANMNDAQASSSGGAILNATSENVAKLREAFTRVSQGRGDARLLLVGDSTTAGQGAGKGGTNFVSARTRSTAAFMAQRLAALGIPAQQESVWGNSGQTPVAYAEYNPAVTIGDGWASGLPSPGYRMFRNSNNASAIRWTPTIPVDTFIVWAPRLPKSASLLVNIDGNSSTEIRLAGPKAFVPTTIRAGDGGQHTISITPGEKGVANLAGIEGYNSGRTTVRIQNWGAPGTDTGVWTSGTDPWNMTPAIRAYAPDASFINLGINDIALDNGASVSSGAYERNLQTIIKAAKSSGDVILVTPTPIRTTSSGLAHWPAMRDAQRRLALSNGCALLDLPALLGSWEQMNARGMMKDGLHPSEAGYAAVGDFYGSSVAQMAGL